MSRDGGGASGLIELPSLGRKGRTLTKRRSEPYIFVLTAPTHPGVDGISNTIHPVCVANTVPLKSRHAAISAARRCSLGRRRVQAAPACDGVPHGDLSSAAARVTGGVVRSDPS